MFVPKAEQTEEEPEGRHWGALNVSCAAYLTSNLARFKIISVFIHVFSSAFSQP
jgi:hypothetical protein